MSLKPLGQIYGLNVQNISINTSERGGILSYGTSSGILIVEYAREPSGAIPIGVQNNDIEHMDVSRHPNPQHHGQRVDQPYAIVGAITKGDVVTDWLCLIGNLMPGQPAYVGPSGTITNSSSFGGSRIGTFISTLESDPHTVLFAGKGYSREVMAYVTHELYIENDPANAIKVITPGYATIRLSTSFLGGKAG